MNETAMETKTPSSFFHFSLYENKEINILLLSDDDVNKTLFINAIANYFQFQNADNVMDDMDIITLIPYVYNIEDKFGNYHILPVGNVNCGNDGGTEEEQKIRTYSFPVRDQSTCMNLIDLPTVIAKDTLKSIGKLDAVLLLSNLHKKSPTYLESFKKIFPRLDASIANKLLFCFTEIENEATNETSAALKCIVSNINSNISTKIVAHQDNCFYIDIETIKYITALSRKITLSDDLITKFINNWQYSMWQCFQIIKYIVGDNLKLNTDIEITTIVNSIDCLLALNRPLGETIELLENNISILENHVAIVHNYKNFEEKKKNMFIPEIVLKTKYLSYPVTVCTNLKCLHHHIVKNVNLYKYITKCHCPCYLRSVTKEIIGPSELLNCSSLAGNFCKVCSCSYMDHMHIYCESEMVFKKTDNQYANKNIKAIDVTLKMNAIMERVGKIKLEMEEITKFAAQFSYYLENSSFKIINNSFKDYIHYLIKREKSHGDKANKDSINRLREVVFKYNETKMHLEDDWIKGESDANSTPRIVKAIDEIFKLPIYGHKLKELFQIQRTIQERHKLKYFYKSSTKKSPKGKHCGKKSLNHDSRASDTIEDFLCSVDPHDENESETRKTVRNEDKKSSDNRESSSKFVKENLNLQHDSHFNQFVKPHLDGIRDFHYHVHYDSVQPTPNYPNPYQYPYQYPAYHYQYNPVRHQSENKSEKK